MKLRRLCLTLAAFLLGGQLLQADILVLKNGEKKEGNILEEKPDAIRMKYKITPKIWDEKDFPRAEIQEIIRQKPEEIEIVEIRKTLPTPDLMTADMYEQVTQDKLRPFVNKYPGTPQAKEVEQMIATMQAEKEKVVAGQLKLEGTWLSAEQVKRDEYNIQAFKIRRSMLDKAAAQDYVGALREFDRLAADDTGYPGSVYYAKAIPEALDILAKYEAVVSRMIAEQPVLQKQRDDSLARMIEPDLSRTKTAIDREVNGWKAQYDAEKKSKMKWLTLYKYDPKTMQEALKVILTERGRLQGMDAAKITARNEALSKARQYLAAESVEAAEGALAEAASIAGKEGSKLISGLRSKINALRTAQAKQSNANRSFGKASSAVSGSSGAITDDDVVTKAMAEADKQREEKKSGGTKKAEATDDKKSDDKKKSADDKDEGDEPKAKKKSSASAADEEESGGMQKYLMIAAGILVVVLVAAFMMQKKPAK